MRFVLLLHFTEAAACTDIAPWTTLPIALCWLCPIQALILLRARAGDCLDKSAVLVNVAANHAGVVFDGDALGAILAAEAGDRGRAAEVVCGAAGVVFGLAREDGAPGGKEGWWGVFAGASGGGGGECEEGKVGGNEIEVPYTCPG